MPDPTTCDLASLTLQQIPVYITAVGALGIAAFGIVDAVGKTLVIGTARGKASGLPFAGFERKIRPLVRIVEKALLISYGPDFEEMLVQQYRAGRSSGQAPTTLRQGVRLGLPFMQNDDAVTMVRHLWGLDEKRSQAFVNALLQEKDSSSATEPTNEEVRAAQALAARFSTALDSRVQAAFDAAEEIYQSQARTWAGAAAVTLAVGYWALATMPFQARGAQVTGLIQALLVGLVATPLAPTAKDLASSLSDALSALGKLPLKKS